MTRAMAGLVACVALGCRAPASADRESALAENRAFTREVIAAIEAKDVDELMAHVRPGSEVIFVGPRGEVGRGWDVLRPVEEGFLASFASARIEIEDETYSIVGDTAVAVSTLRGSFTSANGSVDVARVRMTDVRRREGGKWLAIYNHSHDLDAEPASDAEGR